MRQIKLIVAALFLMSPFAADAVLIEITGAGAADGLWDLTTVYGVPGDPALLDILDDQVWWGDSALAEIYANACGTCLGIQGGIGAYFSYEDWNVASSRGWAYYIPFGYALDWVDVVSISVGWATATRASVPEPGTLALLGIGLAGMGLARRRRRST